MISWNYLITESFASRQVIFTLQFFSLPSVTPPLFIYPPFNFYSNDPENPRCSMSFSFPASRRFNISLMSSLFIALNASTSTGSFLAENLLLWARLGAQAHFWAVVKTTERFYREVFGILRSFVAI